VVESETKLLGDKTLIESRYCGDNIDTFLRRKIVIARGVVSSFYQM
jgi:hypothetical protein